MSFLSFAVGDHGYDNTLPSMHPFLAAHGPAFRKGYEMSSFNSVDLYPLMCHLMGVPPMSNNGSFAHVRCALVNEQCGELALAVGLVMGVLIILTTFTCLFKLMKNRDASSSRPFARLELEDDGDDEPLLEWSVLVDAGTVLIQTHAGDVKGIVYRHDDCIFNFRWTVPLNAEMVQRWQSYWDWAVKASNIHWRHNN